MGRMTGRIGTREDPLPGFAPIDLDHADCDGDDLAWLEGSYSARGYSRIAGVDEAGLGPMAGPVVAAAVMLPPGTRIEGAADSKTLSGSARKELDREIHSLAISIGIGIATVGEIDKVNIYKAGLLAMRRAVEDLRPPPELVLTDARTIPDLPWPQAAYIRGDGRVQCIACASIVAKVLRDGMMADYDLRYPDYGFGRHKGYCTAAHRKALSRLGPSPIHRMSFRPVAEQAAYLKGLDPGTHTQGRGRDVPDPDHRPQLHRPWEHPGT